MQKIIAVIDKIRNIQPLTPGETWGILTIVAFVGAIAWLILRYIEREIDREIEYIASLLKAEHEADLQAWKETAEKGLEKAEKQLRKVREGE